MCLYPYTHMRETAFNSRRCYDCERGGLEERNRKINLHTYIVTKLSSQLTNNAIKMKTIIFLLSERVFFKSLSSNILILHVCEFAGHNRFRLSHENTGSQL